MATILGIGLMLASVFVLRAQSHAKPASAGGQAVVVRWEPARLVNGSPFLIRVRPSVRLKSLTGTWLGHELFFDYNPGTKAWVGFAGVSLETRPGRYLLRLHGISREEAPVDVESKVRVWAAKYPTIVLHVPQKFTAPAPEMLTRIDQEKELKAKVFAAISPERQWSEKFLPAVSTSVSDPFGTRRTFNGAVKSVHGGLDYHAPVGTPLKAINSGTVILARNLFFEGNCVVLDHGQGLLSLYMHLSELRVHEQERVERGQPIGLSGATGRATGPHVHLAVRWQGVYLDPAGLLELRLP
jgi:murein DD-endopeptidase MepM/ murein hydrolase activator NlpD